MSDDHRLEEAARLLAEGRVDDAVELMFNAWSAAPENPDLAISYACLVARAGREREAEELFATLALYITHNATRLKSYFQQVIQPIINVFFIDRLF